MFCHYGNDNANCLATMLNMICVGVFSYGHIEMSDEAHSSVSDCSGDEELSLPWQQKIVICLLWFVCVWLYPITASDTID